MPAPDNGAVSRVHAKTCPSRKTSNKIEWISPCINWRRRLDSAKHRKEIKTSRCPGMYSSGLDVDRVGVRKYEDTETRHGYYNVAGLKSEKGTTAEIESYMVYKPEGSRLMTGRISLLGARRRSAEHVVRPSLHTDAITRGKGGRLDETREGGEQRQIRSTAGKKESWATDEHPGAVTGIERILVHQPQVSLLEIARSISSEQGRYESSAELTKSTMDGREETSRVPKNEHGCWKSRVPPTQAVMTVASQDQGHSSNYEATVNAIGIITRLSVVDTIDDVAW
ncbi:hypothetical protein Hypma_009930 [Hypsizygus marmoreus]|uniref:Uncharacterized protein n=1 Tax=Hypsizygus marmoreus TaxID=39966 RepID=A0A369JTU2_HYPMA|nr:hypothetical protein Hypma_009930 [Hypsizygus marmoreus]